MFKALLPIYRAHIDPRLAPEVLAEVDGARFRATWMPGWTTLRPQRAGVEAKLARLLDGPPRKVAAALRNDPVLAAARSFFDAFLVKARPDHAVLADAMTAAMRTHVKAMMELYPERTFWPDANSTLRLSYGMVEGSEPRDAVVYGAFSTLDGVMEKYVPDDPEFDVPKRLIELHEARDYGPYGVKGVMPVCFTSSLHTTGGNSGSPVLNGRGELIGINFDRTWESTMSDIRFDPAKCRNISVDIRYVLFVVDKFAGAGHLLQEMQLVHNTPPDLIELPIHR